MLTSETFDDLVERYEAFVAQELGKRHDERGPLVREVPVVRVAIELAGWHHCLERGVVGK